MRLLNIGDDQVGGEAARGVERVAAVGDRAGVVTVGHQQIAEQLDVERIVLDNEYLGHAETNLPPKNRADRRC